MAGIYQGAWTGQQIDEAIGRSSRISNNNLADNAFFAGGTGSRFPINHRGQTTYSTSGYTIDRWKMEYWNASSPSVIVNSDCIRLYSQTSSSTANKFWLVQSISNPASLAGKTVTLSALVKSNNNSKAIISMTSGGYSRIPTGNNVFVQRTATLPSTLNALDIRIGLDSDNEGAGALDLSIYAIKLEVGDTQTLAHQEGTTWLLNEIPNWGVEVVRCISANGDSNDTYANQQPSGRSVLWRNSNTGNSFSAQEIQNTSGFLIYHIVFRGSTSASSRYDCVCALETSVYHLFSTVSSPSSGTPAVSFRNVMKNSAGNIEIGQCETRLITANSRTVDNTLLIPEIIYGIS